MNEPLCTTFLEANKPQYYTSLLDISLLEDEPFTEIPPSKYHLLDGVSGSPDNEAKPHVSRFSGYDIFTCEVLHKFADCYGADLRTMIYRCITAQVYTQLLNANHITTPNALKILVRDAIVKSMDNHLGSPVMVFELLLECTSYEDLGMNHLLKTQVAFSIEDGLPARFRGLTTRTPDEHDGKDVTTWRVPPKQTHLSGHPLDPKKSIPLRILEDVKGTQLPVYYQHDNAKEHLAKFCESIGSTKERVAKAIAMVLVHEKLTQGIECVFNSVNGIHLNAACSPYTKDVELTVTVGCLSIIGHRVRRVTTIVVTRDSFQYIIEACSKNHDIPYSLNPFHVTSYDKLKAASYMQAYGASEHTIQAMGQDMMYGHDSGWGNGEMKSFTDIQSNGQGGQILSDLESAELQAILANSKPFTGKTITTQEEPMKQPNTQKGLKAGMSLSEAVAHAKQGMATTAQNKAKKLELNPSASGLGAFFKARVKVHFGKNVTLNAKAFGQLKMLITRLGKNKVYKTMECCLNDWDGFLAYVKQEKNWTPDCKVPNMGILLHLADEMAEYYNMQSGDKDVEEGKTAYQTEDEVATSNKNTIDNIWG